MEIRIPQPDQIALDLDLDLGALGAAAPAAFTPGDLFGGGDSGVWYNISPTYCFQERTGASATTSAGVGDPVGTIAPRAGDANYAIALSDAARGTLRQNGTTGFYYIEPDGTSTGYDLDSSITSATGFSCAAALRTPADQAVDAETIFGSQTGTALSYYEPFANDFKMRLIDGSTRSDTTDIYADETDYVFLGYHDGSDQFIRIDGTQNGTDTVSGTCTIGALLYRADVNDHFGECDLYDMVVIDRELTAQEISDLETYLATLNGVTL